MLPGRQLRYYTKSSILPTGQSHRHWRVWKIQYAEWKCKNGDTLAGRQLQARYKEIDLTVQGLKIPEGYKQCSKLLVCQSNEYCWVNTIGNVLFLYLPHPHYMKSKSDLARWCFVSLLMKWILLNQYSRQCSLLMSVLILLHPWDGIADGDSLGWLDGWAVNFENINNRNTWLFKKMTCLDKSSKAGILTR